MKKNDRTQSGQSRSAPPPAPRRRLRLEKLEERIAPKKKKGGGTFTGYATDACPGSY